MQELETAHRGIVLRRCSQNRDRLWIFDRDDGKVRCTVQGPVPIVGSYIKFYVSKRGDWGAVIRAVTVLDIPFWLAHHNLHFLHHVLELCYYFLSDNNPSTQTFDFVLELYRLRNEGPQDRWMKIFLFKLLISFGSYSSHSPLSMQVFYWLSIESIDSIMNSPLHLEIERSMDDWLCSCVGAHPYFGDFKTVQFLTNLRVP